MLYPRPTDDPDESEEMSLAALLRSVREAAEREAWARCQEAAVKEIEAADLGMYARGKWITSETGVVAKEAIRRIRALPFSPAGKEPKK